MKTTPAGKLSKSDFKAQLAWAEAELQNTLDRAQSLREYIAATRKLSGKKSTAIEQPDLPGITVMPRRRNTKGAELAKHVAEILAAAGEKPMHVRDIVTKLAEIGHAVIAKNPTNTVAVALIRRTDQFVKVSPNTFGLVKKDGTVAETA